jgi:hypothetical protein
VKDTSPGWIRKSVKRSAGPCSLRVWRLSVITSTRPSLLKRDSSLRRVIKNQQPTPPTERRRLGHSRSSIRNQSDKPVANEPAAVQGN